MLILQNTGLHEFMLIILPRYLFITVMGFSYSAFVSKFFVSTDSLILRWSMLRTSLAFLHAIKLTVRDSL